jgi:thiol-disulfide isomerase/thioredoxin
MKQFILLFAILFFASSQAAAQSATGGAVRLEGQIVCCAECWAEAAERGTPYGNAEDREKAVQCIANGDPTLLAVTSEAGVTTLYQLEQGAYKRPGKNWLEFVGKRVEITGATRSKKDKHYIKVDKLMVLSSLEPEAAQPSVIGSEVELALKDMFGVEQRLSAFRGRIVVLNFWATYCVPCRKEMPDLAAIQNQYAALGAQVIGAAADTVKDQPKVLRFIKDTKVNFPIWLGATADEMRRFGLGSALPGTVIIGRDGKVIAQFRGVISQAELKKQLYALLAADASQVKGEIASAKTVSRKASSVPS